MVNTLDIHTLVDLIDATGGDKPESYRLAKMLRDQVDALIEATQPGAGEFKWSAKAVKELTNPSHIKKNPPMIMVARDAVETWHTNGYYMKRGDVPKRFGDVEEVLKSVDTFKAIIPNADLDVVTIIGSHASAGDNVALSNGTVVNRVLITYTMDGFPDVTLENGGKLYPVVVKSAGVVVGLVMSINVK